MDLIKLAAVYLISMSVIALPLGFPLVVKKLYKQASEAVSPVKTFSRFADAILPSFIGFFCLGLLAWDSYLFNLRPHATHLYYVLLNIAMIWPFACGYALYLQSYYLDKLHIKFEGKKSNLEELLHNSFLKLLPFLALMIFIAIIARIER